jgi:hypothetical protein
MPGKAPAAPRQGARLCRAPALALRQRQAGRRLTARDIILRESVMFRLWACCAFGLIAAAAAPPAAAQPQPNAVARCLQLAAIYERHVGKNAAHPLPSMPVDISVAIERCRQGQADGGVALLEAALRAQGFRL